MEIKSFLEQLYAVFSPIDYVDDIVILNQTHTSIKVRIDLLNNGYIIVYYNSYCKTQSFSLMQSNKRIWGLDFDNRIGWHEHPVNNPDSHIKTNMVTVNDIINKLDDLLNNDFAGKE